MYHMDGKNYDDITYNFLIGGDGQIYEGRNWNKIGAHTHGYNSKSQGIAFIGDFNYAYKPTEKQMELLKYLLEYGTRHGQLSESYKIYASEQLDPVAPTGKWLIEALKTLPQFVDKAQTTENGQM